MSEKKGNLSITSENIFPVIKKWLYSDHDIFLRELISNACDAITKIKKLDVMGEYSLPENYRPEIHLVADPDGKTLTISDDGIGMTADEVDKYINQIAFSGATDFLNKFKDKDDSEQIIGHFGLGFYSAFMVADTVDIDTLSYKDGEKAVHWECDGGTTYEMTDGTRDTFGTTITLHINEDCLEFCNEYRVRELVRKYCEFMPYPIYLEKANAKPEYEEIDPKDKLETDTVIETVHHEAKTHENTKDDGTKETVVDEPECDKLKIVKRPVPLNDTTPLWTKNPSECTDDDYKDFYRKEFNDYREPLFWIHLNMDYPFRLKGILYFPRINSQYDSVEGTIKLYNNQVFVADNIKEVIPEFLMLLKGVIDCPDLPLNVSRSALQNDGFVKKISDFITKKVADKLTGMYKTEKEKYEKCWDDISPFVKYGCLKDEKFLEKMNDYILFKDIYDNYTTLPELLKDKKEDAEKSDDKTDEKDSDSKETDNKKNDDSADKEEKKETIYYVTDRTQQSQYIALFKEQKMDAVILDRIIDTSFISQLERNHEGYRFLRIDADVTGSLVESDGEDLKEDTKILSDIFKKAVGDKLTIKVEKLKNQDTAAVLTVSEDMRRMQDMMKMYGMAGEGSDMAAPETLIVNDKNDLVRYIINNPDGDHTKDFAKQIYDLAKISNQPLPPDEMTEFIKRSNTIMMELTK